MEDLSSWCMSWKWMLLQSCLSQFYNLSGQTIRWLKWSWKAQHVIYFSFNQLATLQKNILYLHYRRLFSLKDTVLMIKLFKLLAQPSFLSFMLLSKVFLSLSHTFIIIVISVKQSFMLKPMLIYILLLPEIVICWKK